MLKKMNLMTVLFFLFVAVNATGQSSSIRQVDSILGAWYGEETPAVGVLIMHQGEVQVQKSYGYANMAEKVPADEQTNYDLATLTEQFTVMAALMLQDDQRLEVETPILDIWPNLPEYCKDITLQHLFNHTSGLPVLQTDQLYNDINNFDDLMAFLAGHEKLRTSPGKSAQPNPVNYALLARLIEEKTGESYRDFIEGEIFEPLGMRNTRVYKKGWFSSVPSKSVSYVRRENNRYEALGEFPARYLEGAIGVFSNLHDLQKWLMAWQSDTLISRSLLNKAMRINFRRGQKNFPGYGWTKGFNGGRKYLYQGGIGPGNSHVLLRVPGEQIDVAILSNQSSLFGLRKRAFELVNLYADKEYEAK